MSDLIVKLKEVLTHFECRFIHQLADKLGINVEAIYAWNRKRVVPYDWQVELSRMTNGVLKIDPDITPPSRGGRKFDTEQDKIRKAEENKRKAEEKAKAIRLRKAKENLKKAEKELKKVEKELH